MKINSNFRPKYLKFSLVLYLLFTLSNLVVGAEGNWYKGDLHVHTNYTDCEEAGLYNGIGTVGSRKNDSRDLGLNWISITDHSYCMDTERWNLFRGEVIFQNLDTSFVVLASEELSVEDGECPEGVDNEKLCFRNPESEQDVAHLGAHGIDSFIPNALGYPLINCVSSPGTQEGIDLAKSNSGIAILNHPLGADHSQLLSHTWDWESIDCISNYDGIEVWNGKWSGHDKEALDLWVDKILEGENIFYAFAGSDTEKEEMGKKWVFNSCYMPDLSESNLKSALGQGHCYISNGPELYLNLYGKSDSDMMGGEIVSTSYDDVVIGYEYLIPCGTICWPKLYQKIKIMRGKIGTDSEETIYSEHLTGGNYYVYNVTEKFDGNSYPLNTITESNENNDSECYVIICFLRGNE